MVDNLSLIRDVNFIDQDWTTEHYYEEGRRIMAEHLAQKLKEFYPVDYQYLEIKLDTGHYRIMGKERTLNNQFPYSNAVVLLSDSLRPDWEVVNVEFQMKQSDSLHKTKLVMEEHDSQGNVTFKSYPTWPQNTSLGRWEFVTFTVPLDSTFHKAQQVKIYVANPSEHAVQTKDYDVSFRPAYLKPRVKAQSSR